MHTTRHLWLATLGSAALLACQAADQQVGSACTDGVCPNTTAVRSGLTCQLTNMVSKIGIDDGAPFPGLCLPRPLPTDVRGLLSCRLRWEPDANSNGAEPSSCDPPFLAPADDVAGTCLVRQLTPPERDAGVERGWFYSLVDDCPKVNLAEGVKLPAGNVRLECATASARDQDGVVRDVDPNLCAGLEPAMDPELVGAACIPQLIPERGFDPREASIEAPSADCGTDVCLVYQLSGDSLPGCAPPAECSTAAEFEASVYCSCRCDAPAGVPGPECECPDGFACVEVLDQGPAALRGGYCVRSDTIGASTP